MTKSYVYKGKEVVLTGRIARPEPRRPGVPPNPKLDQYEIRPHDVDPENKSFNEWVRMKDLSEIQD